MDRAFGRRGGWQGVAFALALIALALKVLVPPGFMLAEGGAALAITVCTGHGPLVLHADPGKPPASPAQKKADAPCTGAGNVTPLAPSTVQSVAEPWPIVSTRPASVGVRDLAPGRGLAAPPPPSQGPPPVLS
jgi:hypothetical protein